MQLAPSHTAVGTGIDNLRRERELPRGPSGPNPMPCYKALKIRCLGAVSAEKARKGPVLGNFASFWKQLASTFGLLIAGKCKQKKEDTLPSCPTLCCRLPDLWAPGFPLILYEGFICGMNILKSL